MRKTLLAAICMLMLGAILAGCGKPDYTGFYICDGGNNDSEINSAMQIFKDGTVIYMNSSNNEYGGARLYSLSSKGYIESGKDEGLIYLKTQSFALNANEEEAATYAKYCPLKFAFSDDKKRAYLSADSDEWYADTFEKVSEKEYNAFIEESTARGKYFILWEGDSFMSYSDYTSQWPEYETPAPEEEEAAPEDVETSLEEEEAAPEEEEAAPEDVELSPEEAAAAAEEEEAPPTME